MTDSDAVFGAAVGWTIAALLGGLAIITGREWRKARRQAAELLPQASRRG